MEFTCSRVSASAAGDEIFQLSFDNDSNPDNYDLDSPYLLLQRAWLEEEEGASGGVYVECQNMDVCGHYDGGVVAELTRDRIHLHLPTPNKDVIKVSFSASDKEYEEAEKMLAVILNDQKY